MKYLNIVYFEGEIEYLAQVIESWAGLDFGAHEVTRLIVAIDNPQKRNENILEMFGKVHNCLLWRNPAIDEVENWIKNQNYDYIIRQRGGKNVVTVPDKQY